MGNCTLAPPSWKEKRGKGVQIPSSDGEKWTPTCLQKIICRARSAHFTFDCASLTVTLFCKRSGIPTFSWNCTLGQQSTTNVTCMCLFINTHRWPISSDHEFSRNGHVSKSRGDNVRRISFETKTRSMCEQRKYVLRLRKKTELPGEGDILLRGEN